MRGNSVKVTYLSPKQKLSVRFRITPFKMTPEEVMKGNIKLTVFDSFPYNDLKKVIDAICNLGYDCEFVDNGNIVFQKK